jgi:hypothetical protein
MLRHVWLWTVLSPGIRRVVRWISTAVSEEYIASIFRVEEWSKQETSTKQAASPDIQHGRWRLTGFQQTTPRYIPECRTVQMLYRPVHKGFITGTVTGKLTKRLHNFKMSSLQISIEHFHWYSFISMKIEWYLTVIVIIGKTTLFEAVFFGILCQVYFESDHPVCTYLEFTTVPHRQGDRVMLPHGVPFSNPPPHPNITALYVHNFWYWQTQSVELL